MADDEAAGKAPVEKKKAQPVGTLPREQKKCRIGGCKRPYRAKGYCVTHYRLWRRGEMTKAAGTRGARYRQCGKEDCKKPTAKGGLCQTHFDEARAKGVEKAAEAPAPAPAPAPAAA